ncbi:MAG: ABC transporter substrate-binding protein [Devosia sp. 67-54]|uniref:ABC transporter substrate-binding protein n=1 Tax=unclassified Devosia TaxID=196773 RepID=UPI00086F40D4|nr:MULTISPECIES: ABC transporter substrate-binding protein [unclassified Devosia]MBN9303586.1 ABC transporter substrate-binding protein [Devosia sp.]ODU52673.1 MAG: ABC transporter substrate-binding protein [Microbacterium sp. SCN 70-10]OJX17480.1 MAG: ABC transporter substrate-binding protein [Devosia sp. 67-54]
MNLKSIAGGLLLGALLAGSASAATLSIVNGDTGGNLQWLRGVLDEYQKTSGDTINIVPMPSSTTDQFGQYKLWLAAGNSDIDVYQTDVIWAPQLSDQFVDLSTAAKDVSKDFFPSIIESQTVNGKLVAIPFFTDAPALFYRKDLLEKYKLPVPKTWTEMASEAKTIQDGERAAGNKDFWGFVFQGNAYEGLTCDALEWVKSYGGGQIVEPDGSISINNPKAVAALEEAKSWVNTISPPGVLSYGEEESRGVWQLGNAAFMRNWPYAYALGNAADSPIKGKFDVSTLPVGAEGDKPASTLGGWNLAVSKYSKNQDAAIKLVMYLSSAEVQKKRAIDLSALPTRQAIYDDADVAKAQPIIPNWKSVFQNAVPRPSAPTKTKYNEVSNLFWSAVHDTLSGNGSAADNLEQLEAKLTDLKGAGW